MTTLKEFRDAWAASTKDDRSAAVVLAEQYVAENETYFETMFGDASLEELVAQVDLARGLGKTDVVTQIDIWLLAKFEKQRIGGNVTVREIAEPTRRKDRKG